MSIGISGLYNIPAIIGICIGGFIGGALTDWIAERMARRNNGVFEPESRLIALVIPFFLEPIGLIMYFLFFPRLRIGMELVLRSWIIGRLDSLDMGFCASVWQPSHPFA